MPDRSKKPMLSPLQTKTTALGDMSSFGDTKGGSLDPMYASRERQRASRARQRTLSNTPAFIRTSSYNKQVEAAQRRQQQEEEQRLGKRAYLGIWLRELSYQRPWAAPLAAMILTYGTFFLLPNHTESNPLYPFLFLSYKIPGTDPVLYGKGPKDFLFVIHGMILFTFLREFSMQVLLKPVAGALGLTKKGKVKRFTEQAYSMMYYGVTGPVGIAIMHHMPLWYFRTEEFYLNFPHKYQEFDLKAYYLLQAAFWSQQSLVLLLRLEKPRKDFHELCLHHVVTISLITLSYRFHFTWMGLAVYLTMDISDFFLSLSKILNYLDSAACFPAYFLFVSIWIYLRHYINCKILWSVIYQMPNIGDFTLNWDTQQYKCWISQYITFGLLLALQLVNLYWLFLIIRIAYKVVTVGQASDVRSDDEEDDDQPETPVDNNKKDM